MRIPRAADGIPLTATDNRPDTTVRRRSGAADGGVGPSDLQSVPQDDVNIEHRVLGRTTGLASTGPAGSVTFASTYDKASLPLTTSFTAFGLSAFTISNSFAKTGQWQKTSTANSQEWAFTFGTDGTFRRAASALSSRGLVYNTFLQLDRVRLSTTNNAFTAEEALTYDGYGRVASSTMAATGTDLDADNAYTYDAAGRLKTWTLDGATTTYNYDAAGNLTGIVRPGAEPDTTFESDVESRLTTATTAGAVTTYASDDFGRRISESSATGVTDYTWNSLGRLTSVTSEDTTSTYEYGPSGMRERVTVESVEGTTTTEAVWAGGKLVAECDGDGTLYRYLYGPNGLPLEMIVTSGTTTNAYTYQCDRAGSVIALTDANGAVVETYSYDPWGEPIDQPSSGVGARNPLRYRGYYYDTATGTYYLPARYYDPSTARFLSADPAAPSAGDPLSLNRYAYCVGDPINASDPSGAIMDSDGNGRLDNYDHSLASSKTTKGKTSEFYKIKARGQYAQASGDVQGTWKATFEIFNLGEGWRLGTFIPSEAELASRAAREDAEAREEARQATFDAADSLQGIATAVGIAAGVVLLVSPVGWVAGVAAVASGVYLAAGAFRASQGDSEYPWERFAFDATVTAVTMGVGGGAAYGAGTAVQRVSGAAWLACDGAVALAQ